MKIYNYIKKFKNTKPIINFIINDIDNGKLIIRNFDEIDNRTYVQMREYMLLRNIINENASRIRVINKAKITYSGWCYNNIIYNNNDLSKGLDMLNTIIHEYIHYNRKYEKIFKYGTPNQIFIEEFFAYLVANYTVDSIKSTKNIKLDYAYINTVIIKVLESYNLQIKNPWLLIMNHINEIRKFLE